MPVWLRRMASRRSTSMAAVASWPGLDRALDDARVVAVEAGQPVGGVVDHRGAGVGADDAGVAHLAAALGVERRAVEEDRHLVASPGTTASTVAFASTSSRPTNSEGPWSSRICWKLVRLA